MTAQLETFAVCTAESPQYIHGLCSFSSTAANTENVCISSWTLCYLSRSVTSRYICYFLLTRTSRGSYSYQQHYRFNEVVASSSFLFFFLLDTIKRLMTREHTFNWSLWGSAVLHTRLLASFNRTKSGIFIEVSISLGALFGCLLET